MAGVEDRAHGPGQPVRVVACPRNEVLVVCFAGPCEGLLTHWTGSRGAACQGVEHCPAAVHKLRTIWKGYAPVRCWLPGQESWQPAVLEVTEHLEEQLRGRLLLGEVWMIQRQDPTKKNSPVLGSFVEVRHEEALRAPFSIVVPLQRMYHTLNLDLGRANPLPGKLVLNASAARAPQIPAGAAPEPPPPPTPEQWQRLRELTGRGEPGKKRQGKVGADAGTNGKHSAGP